MEEEHTSEVGALRVLNTLSCVDSETYSSEEEDYIDEETLEVEKVIRERVISRRLPKSVACIKDFDSFEFLAEGGISHVWKAKEIEEPYAIKKLNWKATGAYGYLAEMLIMTMLEENVFVQLFHCFFDGNMYFVMELCEGSLENALTPFHENRCTRFTMQMSDAFSILYDKGIVHNDVAPRNILVDCNRNFKVADFGLAYFDEDKDKLTRAGYRCGGFVKDWFGVGKILLGLLQDAQDLGQEFPPERYTSVAHYFNSADPDCPFLPALWPVFKVLTTSLLNQDNSKIPVPGKWDEMIQFSGEMLKDPYIDSEEGPLLHDRRFLDSSYGRAFNLQNKTCTEKEYNNIKNDANLKLFSYTLTSLENMPSESSDESPE